MVSGDFPGNIPPTPIGDVPEKPIIQILEEELAKVQGWIEAGVMTHPEAVAYLDQFETYWEAIGTQREQQAFAGRAGEQQRLQAEANIRGAAALGGEYLDAKNAVLAQDASYQQKTTAIQNLTQEYFAKGVRTIASVDYQQSLQNQIIESLSSEQREQATSLGQLDPRTFAPIGAGGEVTRPRPLIPPRFAEFEPTFAEVSATVSGTQRMKDFFQSRFPELLRRFQALQPETLPTADIQEANWAEFLRKRIPKIQEEFAQQSPFARGERPSVFQPRIKTVGF